MSAKVLFLTAFLGLGGYVGYTAVNYDPSIVPYSKAEVQARLANAKSTIPRGEGERDIVIRGDGPTADGVRLAMQYSLTAPAIRCHAVITELGPKESRVVANCSGLNDKNSVAGGGNVDLQAPLFDEHIQSTLMQRPFDNSRMQSLQMGAVLSDPDAAGNATRNTEVFQQQNPQVGASSSTGSGGWGADTPSGESR